VARSTDRDVAVASVEEACPRCGAPRGPRQEYCVECGLRLPRTTGVVAGLRRRWLRRFGWYPGDWIWTSLLGLVVAAAGASVAIALSSHGTKGGTTIVATPPPPATTAPPPAATTTQPAPPEPTTSTTTTTATTTTAPTTTTPPKPTAAPSGETVWPASQSGWTIVLGSYPVSGGHLAPEAVAKRAAKRLSQVGVLDSSDWSSLHPGYYVVFSGIYPSQAAAQAAVSHAQEHGFGTAYVRQIVH
jgi:cell division septation protein DedD